MENQIMDFKLNKYFRLTMEALDEARKSKEKISLDALKNARKDFLDMAERYFDDAKHFKEKGEVVNAFAALNYAHGFLDAGARLGVFDVHNSKLFAMD